MEQLLKVTSIPFQAIRFTQNARLIPADHVSLERQKALARHRAFQSRYRAAVSSIDFEYINKVKTAFSKKTSFGRDALETPSYPASSPPKAGFYISDSGLNQVAEADSGPVSRPSDQVAATVSDTTAAAAAALAAPHRSVSPETVSAYAVQRGSFELRVAKGELSYVPPLVMTIVTQYPDIHFEYTGGFHYVPPREDQLGVNMNLSI